MHFGNTAVTTVFVVVLNLTFYRRFIARAFYIQYENHAFHFVAFPYNRHCNHCVMSVGSRLNVISNLQNYTLSQKNRTPATFYNNSNSPSSIAIDFDKNNC